MKGRGDDGTLGPIMNYMPYVDPPFTGQITGVVAGSPRQGPDVEGTNGFLIIGHPDNTDTAWWFDTSKTKAQGFPVGTSVHVLVPVRNLNQIKFDVDVSGETVCWQKV